VNRKRRQREDEAVHLYERILKCSNHLDLFSEMLNPAKGESLDNFPQALTRLNITIASLELNQTTLWEWYLFQCFLSNYSPH